MKAEEEDEQGDTLDEAEEEDEEEEEGCDPRAEEKKGLLSGFKAKKERRSLRNSGGGSSKNQQQQQIRNKAEISNPVTTTTPNRGSRGSSTPAKQTPQSPIIYSTPSKNNKKIDSGISIILPPPTPSKAILGGDAESKNPDSSSVSTRVDIETVQGLQAGSPATGLVSINDEIGSRAQDDPKESPSANRMQSLDFFRGATIVGMMMVDNRKISSVPPPSSRKQQQQQQQQQQQ